VDAISTDEVLARWPCLRTLPPCLPATARASATWALADRQSWSPRLLSDCIFNSIRAFDGPSSYGLQRFHSVSDRPDKMELLWSRHGVRYLLIRA
jgi:hypothetical protein